MDPYREALAEAQGGVGVRQRPDAVPAVGRRYGRRPRLRRRPSSSPMGGTNPTSRQPAVGQLWAECGRRGGAEEAPRWPPEPLVMASWLWLSARERRPAIGVAWSRLVGGPVAGGLSCVCIVVSARCTVDTVHVKRVPIFCMAPPRTPASVRPSSFVVCGARPVPCRSKQIPRNCLCARVRISRSGAFYSAFYTPCLYSTHAGVTGVGNDSGGLWGALRLDHPHRHMETSPGT